MCVSILHLENVYLLVNALLEQDYAHEASQKYKEGKFILERNLLVDVQ